MCQVCTFADSHFCRLYILIAYRMFANMSIWILASSCIAAFSKLRVPDACCVYKHWYSPTFSVRLWVAFTCRLQIAFADCSLCPWCCSLALLISILDLILADSGMHILLAPCNMLIRFVQIVFCTCSANVFYQLHMHRLQIPDYMYCNAEFINKIICIAHPDVLLILQIWLFAKYVFADWSFDLQIPDIVTWLHICVMVLRVIFR